MTPAQLEACKFYETRYDVVFEHLYQRSQALELGSKRDRKCRFCGEKPPKAKFQKIAHAVPEALGNRGLISHYECDECNEGFGQTIENDLGEWTKPSRTFMQIKGKNGIPTLKKGSQGGWRIEYDDDRFAITSYEDDPLFELSEENHRITFNLKRGKYTPVGVLKAFVKIGLTLLPDAELTPFAEAFAWIKETDHSRSWVRQTPVIHTFIQGPMPNDKIALMILRRKGMVKDVPYAFLILGYGNDVFQVALPAPNQDKEILDQKLNLPAFPTPLGFDPEKYGNPSVRLINLTAREPVSGDVQIVRLGFESLEIMENSGDS